MVSTDYKNMIGKENNVSLGIDLNDPSALAPLFDSLTDQYGDPINDLTREVISNAIDSTMRVPEKDRKPIIVTSPTEEDPYFTVEDFGQGMTPEIIENNYTSFLSSTKINDVNQIGSHGQGAKAPLTYCDKYTVVSTKDGITTEFYIARTKLSYTYGFLEIEENTKNPNGTKVIIPSNPSDSERFHKALKSYKKYSFDIPLIIDNNFYETNNDYVQLSTFNFSENSEKEGRIFVYKEALEGLFQDIVNKKFNIKSDINYSIGGWFYNSPEAKETMLYYTTPKIIVELIPGVVDFTKSRSDIVKNQKSANLHREIVSFIGQWETLDKILEVYRTFTDKDSLEFATKLVYRKKYVNEKKININESFFDFSEFTTNSGFNPFELIYTKKDSDSYIINYDVEITALLKKNDYSLSNNYNHDYAYTVNNKDFNILYPEIGEKARISKIISIVKEAFNSNAPISSSGDVFASILLSKKKREKTKITVLKNIDKKQFNFLMRSNSIINDDPNYHLVVIPENIDEVNKNINIYKNFLNIKTIECSDFVDYITNIKKEKGRSTSTKEDFGLTTIKVHNYGDFNDIVEKIINKQDKKPKTEYTNLNSIISEKKNLILFDPSFGIDNVIKGMSNSNKKISGDVLIIKDYRQLYAGHYRLLKDYENLFVSKNWKCSSKTASNTINGKIYYDKIFDKVAEGLSKTEIISAFVSPNNLEIRSFLKEFAIYIMGDDKSIENEDILDLSLNLLSALNDPPSRKALDIVTLDFFKENIENSYIYIALSNLIKKIQYSTHYHFYNGSGDKRPDFFSEGYILCAVINNPKRSLPPVLEKEIFKLFLDSLEKEMNKKM